MVRKIGVLTSGGDAPGMNAAVRSITRYGIYREMEVYGIKRGYEGLIDGEVERLYRRSVGDILQRGGTILQTARSERFRTREGMEKAYNVLKELKIENLIVIGGDGTLTGAKEFSNNFGVNVIGLPGTIDNDLAYTDETIGFDTAINTVLEGITRIRDTSSSHERTTIIEVMGRRCGDIALYAGLTGGAESVLLPELDNDLDAVCEKVLSGVREGKLHDIIIKAEGVPVDSQELVKIVAERTGRDVKLVVLSYLQRGGSPTFRDRMLATMSGAKAIDLIMQGEKNRAIGVKNGEIFDMDIAEALKASRIVDLDLYKGVDILSM